MTKKEVIWREILFQKRQNNTIKFTQQELAKKFSFSVSTVFNALKSLRQANIIRVTGRFFVLEDYKKLLYLWASTRNFKKDIYYNMFINEETAKIEAIMPPETIFGAYSGFKMLYAGIPAEYDHVYVYLEKKDLAKFFERVSDIAQDTHRISHSNLFILEPDQWLQNYPKSLLEQLFVDIWNAPEWYAKDFLKALEDKII